MALPIKQQRKRYFNTKPLRVENFIKFDTKDNIKGYKEFLAEGDKYGWD